MQMGISDNNNGFIFDGLGTLYKPTAFELNIKKTEVQMQKLLSSPFISLIRHEEMMNSIISPPVLEAIQKQQCMLEDLSLVNDIYPSDIQHLSILQNLPSQSLIDSVTRSLKSFPASCLIENMAKTLNSVSIQYDGLVNILGRSLDIDILKTIAASEQEFRGISRLLGSFQDGLSAIRDMTYSIDFSPFLEISNNSNLFYISNVEEKHEMLKSFGWYLISELPNEIVDDIYERRYEITQDEVDMLISQYFRDNKCYALKQIIDSWLILPYFKTRKDVFREAQVCHSRRSYIASTTLISLQLEGVVTDFVRDRIMSPTYHKWAEKALVCINDLTNDLTLKTMPFEDWLVYSYVLECVDKAFSTNFSPSDPDSCPNTSRHKIAHGHAIAKETEANSLRLFLFMNELYKLFCCLEKEYQLAS